MEESFTDRHNRDRGARSRQLEYVAQGLRDLRSVDGQVSITPVEEDAQDHISSDGRSDVDYLRIISRGVDHRRPPAV